jgi:hypothetical protein
LKENTNEQMILIQNRINECKEEQIPSISVDAKNKEKIGTFKNNGKTRLPIGKPIRVNEHDFIDSDTPVATPYGIYDIIKNVGFVNIGTSHDTGEFAVNSIRSWWAKKGKSIYNNSSRIVIFADAGGSNNCRFWLWKLSLQLFSNEINKIIEVHHYPPSKSKFNKIEHRMFSEISKNWSGRPLKTIETVKHLIESTTTKTGLVIKATIDKRVYKTGIFVNKTLRHTIHLVRSTFEGLWNYCIYPKPDFPLINF